MPSPALWLSGAPVEPVRAIRQPGLRRVVTGAVAALAVMVLCVSTSLVLLTTKLHTASSIVRESVESVHLADRAQADILLHERSRDPVSRMSVESDLRGRLEAAR